MTLHRGSDGAHPLRPEPIGRLDETRVVRRGARAWRLGGGTLACPHCDAPVAPGGTLSPAAPLACPFCRHAARVRDFLTLESPSRPARVEVRVVDVR